MPSDIFKSAGYARKKENPLIPKHIRELVFDGGRVQDDSGNVATIKFFGSKEKALLALASLDNCNGCVNCQDCKNCEECLECVNCIDSRCLAFCKDCENCSRCFGVAGYKDQYEEVNMERVPVIKNIHQELYKTIKVEFDAGKFDMCIWHDGEGTGTLEKPSCGTVHCRAGWVTHFAGFEGQILDYILNDTERAAELIYEKNGYEVDTGYSFYQPSEEAVLHELKFLAEMEAQGKAPNSWQDIPDKIREEMDRIDNPERYEEPGA